MKKRHAELQICCAYALTSYKHLRPTALTLALPRKRQTLWNTENLALHLFTIYDSRFTDCN